VKKKFPLLKKLPMIQEKIQEENDHQELGIEKSETGEIINGS